MKRDLRIDSLKGIGIVLVVLGHHNNFILRNYIYSFHMPLFFFISGYLHRTENINFEYLKRKKSLIKKYFLGSSILFLFWMLIGRKVGLTAKFSGSIKDNLFGIFYGSSNLDIGARMDWGVQMWFIPTIILTGYFCNFLLKKQNIIFILITLISLNFFKIKLPFNLENIIIVIPFYLIGYFSKVYSNSFLKNQKAKLMSILTATIIAFIGFKLNGSIDIRTGAYGNIFWFYVTAFSNIYLLYILLDNQKQESIFGSIGKISLEIMIYHLLILKLLKGVYLYSAGIDIEKSEIVFPIINSILIILIVFCISKQIMKYKKIGVINERN
ncbi:MAG: acyltransferase family protein [Fusobacteriaceae bacterium]